MRAICLVTFVLAMVGCGKDTLDDTTYRRLVDTFDSYDQCLAEGDFAPCYQSLTFCADGRVNANLEFRQEGSYRVIDQQAIGRLPTVTFEFDLEKLQSPELPGRHSWELVEPQQVDCATH
jgi:hypothetical protein